MGHHVVAKFRCLSLNHKYDGIIMAELKPVQQKGVNAKENAEFWSYSPNGECSLTYFKKCPLELGAYYYINMVSEEGVDGPDLWKLSSFTKYDEGAAEVSLAWYCNYDCRNKPEGLLSGNIRIGMEKKAEGAIQSFSESGTKWKVSFDFAEASDEV